MDAHSDQVKLIINVDADEDTEELARLSQQLRAELLLLDVADVDVPRVSMTPAGAKAGDVLTWGTLLVTLGAAKEALPAVISVVQSWLARRDNHSVTMEFGNDRIVLTGASSDQIQQLTDLWIAHHRPQEG
jgi:hypothetical protein